jgi:hypothetical protein
MAISISTQMRAGTQTTVPTIVVTEPEIVGTMIALEVECAIIGAAFAIGAAAVLRKENSSGLITKQLVLPVHPFQLSRFKVPYIALAFI